MLRILQFHGNDLTFCMDIRNCLFGKKKREDDLLVHDDTDSIVEQTFAKDDGVEFGVNFVLLENG